MLEKMDEFFDARLDGYEEHQLTCIDGAEEFYPFTAECLPKGEVDILDLGCGTGLELNEYFKLSPTSRVTGIDLAKGMLAELERKFSGRKLTLICGSYFDVDLGREAYDGIVSVESLHHFTKEEKTGLYKKLVTALRMGGSFILTDYFAHSDEEEEMLRAELIRLKKEQGIEDGEFYHYDTPLTVAHEVEVLKNAGFMSVEVLKSWGATHTIRATKWSCSDEK